MEKIKLEIAGIPAVLYGKRSRRVYLYVHGKNGSAAEAARFARTACPAGWQVLAVDLPEHGTRKNSPEKLVPWVLRRWADAAMPVTKATSTTSIKKTSRRRYSARHICG